MQTNDSWLQIMLEIIRKMVASPYGLWIVGILSALLALVCWSMIRGAEASESLTNSSKDTQN